MPKKILVAGAFGTGNLGDDAILNGLLRRLTHSGEILKCNIVVFSRNPYRTALQEKVCAKRRNLLDIIRSDIVIIGGGSLFTDWDRMALKYSVLGILSKLLSKKTVFYAVGVSSIQNPITRVLTILSLNLADEISVRDAESRAQFINLGIKKTIKIVEDPALDVEPISCELARQFLNNFGISYNNKVIIGVTSQFIPHEESNTTNFFLLDIFSKLLREFDALQIIFIPFSTSRTLNKENDVAYGKWFQKQLKNENFVVLNCQFTPSEIMGILSICDIVISTRLHPLILSFQVNTTAIGVGVWEKVFAFCKQHNLPIIDSQSPTESYTIIEKIIEQKLKYLA